MDSPPHQASFPRKREKERDYPSPLVRHRSSCQAPFGFIILSPYFTSTVPGMNSRDAQWHWLLRKRSGRSRIQSPLLVHW